MTCPHPTPAAYAAYRWLLSTQLPELRRLHLLVREPVADAEATIDYLEAALSLAIGHATTTAAARNTAAARAKAERSGDTANLPLIVQEQVAASAAAAVLLTEKAAADATAAEAAAASLAAELAAAEEAFATIYLSTPTEADVTASLDEIGARTYDSVYSVQVELVNDPTPAQSLARWYIAGSPTHPF